MFLIHTLPQQIWTAAMLTVAAYALWRGGWGERTIAWGMVVDSLTSGIVQNTRDWGAPQWADLGIDILYLIVMVGVALKSARMWPLWAAGFQLVSVIVYFARIADMKVGAFAPYLATVIWSYLILVVIAIGTWLHGRDRSLGGAVPSPPTRSSAT